MLASILASGLAAGAIYALVGAPTTPCSDSEGDELHSPASSPMLGGVFGSMFTLKMGHADLVGFLLTLLGCAIIGVITEFVAVRPVLKKASTSILCGSPRWRWRLMIQQVARSNGHRNRSRIPRLVGWGQWGV